MSTEMNRYLETERLGVLMRKYAVPCIISMLVAALYNIVDQIFIANAAYLGSYGNAANTVVFPMTVVAIAIAVMIGNGCCAFVSISLGRKNTKDAANGVGNAVVTVIAVSLVLTAVYLIFQAPILRMFGADVNEETFRLSKEYFFWITLGIPFYMFGQAMNPIIRSDGDQAYAMAMLLVGAAFNIIFDPICIYVLKWGMKGAALATIGGQILSALIGAIYLFHMKATPLDGSCFRIRWKLIGKVLSLGVSDFFSQFSIVLSMAATINMAVKYGALDPVFSLAEYSQIPTAIAGIVSKFFQIIISVSVGLAAGCTPIVGYNYGAGRNNRVIGILNRLIIEQTRFGLAATLVVLFMPNQLMLIFGSANESTYYTEFAVWFIRCQLCLLPFACVNKASFIFLQALGKARQASILSVTREFILGAGFALLLPAIGGLYALPFFMPAADTVTVIAVAVVLLKVKKELETA
ncbi:MAG: polysaccharide biosynthesis C-terminal domain-containing protein [Lachnospiraceae bacterium]|nr:polysaccharide biosynthesis C-terminal domain-containing protein [Lachnospiraceae bacterium]